MAENNLKNQLDDIVAGKKQIQKNDNFFVTLSISEADFRSLSSRDLENIESLLENCNDDDLVTKIRYKIGERKKELGIVDVPEVQQEGQGSQPSPADSQTKEGDLPHAEFMSVPSYSLYKNYQKLDNKAKNGEANETEGQLIKDYVDNAKKIADLAANEEITPEQAVFLKDYLEILNSTVENGKYNKELEAKVDEQLKVFDEENGLGELKDTPEHQKLLETKEKSWHEIAQSYNWDENVDNETMDVLTNLCIQELKLKDDSVITDKVYEIFAKKYNTTPDNAQRVCMELINKRDAGTMKGIDEQLFGDYLNTLHEAEVDTFRQKFEDLKSQLEATRAIERAKLIAEELYPEKPGMSEEDLEEIRKKREKYLKEQLSREDGLPGKEKWIEENALRALRDKHHIADGDDEKIKADLKDEYEELRKAYSHIADEIDTATNTAYVLRVEALANRSARLTGAEGINPQTQKFLKDYTEKNKDSYKVGKMALSIGKSVALSRGVRYAFGFKGMAAYSAYQTSQAVKKSWAKYKKSMPNGEKASLLGYCKYLKDNPKELTDIVSKVSKTAVMSSLAVAGTALGIDNVPGVSAAIVGGINAATAAVKIHQNKEAIKNTWKNRKQIAENFKEKHPNLKKFGKWGAALLGVAAAGYAAYKIFAPDEVKDAVDDGMSDLDNDLLNNSNNENMTDAEREEILKNVENISKNGNGDITDPLNLKGGENTTTETSATEQGANDATQAAADAVQVPEDYDKTVLQKVIGSDRKGYESGPDPIIKRLKDMGVMTKDDEEALINASRRNDGPKIGSKALAAYLGLQDKEGVSVRANLSPEQQKELYDMVTSEEYRAECAKLNSAHAAHVQEQINNHLAKARAAAEETAKHDADGSSGENSGKGAENTENSAQNDEVIDKEYTAARVKKLLLFNKLGKPETIKVNGATKAEIEEILIKEQGFTKEEAHEMVSSEEFYKRMAKDVFFNDNPNAKGVRITDEDGSSTTYYRDKTNSNGEVTSKQIYRDTENNKMTVKDVKAKNGAELTTFKGRNEVVTFTNANGEVVNIGTEDKDKILIAVKDPKSGNTYTLVKGDDNKNYTFITDTKGNSKIVEGGSKSSLKQIYNKARESVR